MIECKDCKLPTLPPVLFWEGVFGMRMPCLCGCMERAGAAAGPRVLAPLELEEEAAEIAGAFEIEAPDPDLYEQLRASDEGMPERQAPARRMARTQDFRKWLETRDKKTLAATAANRESGVVVRKTFRPLLLRGVFQALNEDRAAPQIIEAQPKEEVLYMSGWTSIIR